MIWKSLLIFAFMAGGVLTDELQANVDQLKGLLRTQCKNNGAEDKVDDVIKAGQSFLDCVRGLVDANQLQKEIEEAKPNGALDEVFKKYCEKTPQLKTCIHTVLDGISPCLNPNEHDQLNPAKNGTDQLIDFICYKDGDRIALFIAESGPECFQEKANSIRDCFTNLKNSVSTVDAAKKLSVAEKCGKYDELSACVVSSLEQCSTPTPGNMAESLFRYVRKGTPCHTALPKN